MKPSERRFTFNAVAATYASARPGYPEAVFATIAGATTGRRLLEIGSGPGKATPCFVAQGFEVTAVEPGPALIAEARKNPALREVRFEQSTFEAWSPPEPAAFDVVAAAQAWHWVDPAVGYAKAADVLAPAGVLAVIGNVAPFPEGPLKGVMADVYERLAPEIVDAERFGTVSDYYTEDGPITAQITASGRFDQPRHLSFAWSQSYGVANYLAMISTFSDHQMIGQGRLETLLDEIGEAIEAHGGGVDLEYRTHLILARRAD